MSSTQAVSDTNSTTRVEGQTVPVYLEIARESDYISANILINTKDLGSDEERYINVWGNGKDYSPSMERKYGIDSFNELDDEDVADILKIKAALDSISKKNYTIKQLKKIATQSGEELPPLQSKLPFESKASRFIEKYEQSA